MTYKQYLTGSIVSLLLFSIGYFAFVYFIYQAPMNVKWTYEMLQRKERIAQRVETPKLVIGGGSNALFGVDTSAIEKALGRPAINMAIRVSLGVDYMFNFLKTSVSPGDTLIVILEYELLAEENESVFSTYRDYLLTHDRAYFNRLPLMERAEILASIGLSDLLGAIIQTYFIQYDPNRYNAKTIDDHGDETYKPFEKRRVGKTNVQYRPFNLPEQKETYGLRKLASLALWCEKNGVHFYFAFPNTIEFEAYNNKDYKSYFSFLEHYFHKHNIGVLGTPYDALYEIEMFYDQNYHLNDVGAKKRTKRLIKLIREVSVF